MAKIKNPHDLFIELNISHQDGYGEIFGRQFRYLRMAGLIQIGDNDFDRWANSIELSFDIWLKKGQRQFIKWFNEQKDYYERNTTNV